MSEENVTETDVSLFSKKKPKPEPSGTVEIDSVPTENVKIKINPRAEYYEINQLKRGIALIFNHYKYENPGMSKREGTQKDCEDLNKVLKSLEFEVQIHNDLKYGDIEKVLDKTSKADHSDRDSLLVVVMTHGDRNVISSRDLDYPPDTLWKKFAGDKCKSLAGKPKIFLIQACRGNELDAGVRRSTIQFDSAPTFKIPTMADILIMYSSYEGHYSFRSTVNGSWFIQSVCSELESRARKEDLLSILTSVNRRVAIDYESYTPNNREFDKKKQIGMIVSTLTKKFMFFQTPDQELDKIN